MTLKEKNKLIQKIEEKIPTLESSKKSSYSAGKRDAYLSMVMEIISMYHGDDFDE